jgi:FkbM family methyltransferase
VGGVNIQLPVVEGLDVEYAYRDEESFRDIYWLVRPSDVVLDVGCGMGGYTVAALMLGASMVYAVDPHAHNLQVLQECVHLNDLDPSRVTHITRALYSDDAYPPELMMETTPYEYGGIMPNDQTRFSSIDEIADEYALDRLDWIKIDTEGSELGVVRGGLQTLAKLHPKLIIEDHTSIYSHLRDGKNRASLVDSLESVGYELEAVPYESPVSADLDRTMLICQ